MRPAFAAELYALLGTPSTAVLASTALAEVLRGPKTAREIIKLQDASHQEVELDILLDARPVSDAFSAEA